MLSRPTPTWAENKKPGLFDFEMWKTPAAHERDAAKHLAPDKLDLSAEPSADAALRTVRLRVYADRDYRMIVLRWQRRLRAQIERVNAVSGPVFGVRFELESVREWDRSHTGAALESMLGELEALDPARDVDWVIGLVTPMRGIATSIHQVGLARILARHFVMRGMDDEQEILALEREWKLLTPDERQGLYGDRKSHKEVVFFLHEWGHTLGLLHHEDPTAIMNPSYDAHQAAFSLFEKRVVSLVVSHRLAPAPDGAGKPGAGAGDDRDLYPESVDLETLLAEIPSEEGSDKDRAQLLELVHARAHGNPPPGAGAGAGGPSHRGPPTGFTPADIDSFNRAVTAANQRHAEPAWAEIAPLVHRLTTGDAQKTRTDPAFTLRIAALAANLGALTAAEILLARGRTGPSDAGAQKLAGEIESTRCRVALPAPRAAASAGSASAGEPSTTDVDVASSLATDREPTYVAAFWETSRLVTGRDRPAARARLAALAADFPDAPGVDVLGCDLELRSGKKALAIKRCNAALAKFEGATRALLLLASIEDGAGRDTVAEKYLRRAIQLDPTEREAWRMLARHYRLTRASQRLAELANQHQALFSEPLPE